MIAGKINKIKKAAKQLWKKEGDSLNYYELQCVIDALEKLDKGEELTTKDLAHIHYPFKLFQGDIKQIGDYYIEYYCR